MQKEIRLSFWDSVAHAHARWGRNRTYIRTTCLHQPWCMMRQPAESGVFISPVVITPQTALRSSAPAESETTPKSSRPPCTTLFRHLKVTPYHITSVALHNNCADSRSEIAQCQTQTFWLFFQSGGLSSCGNGFQTFSISPLIKITMREGSYSWLPRSYTSLPKQWASRVITAPEKLLVEKKWLLRAKRASSCWRSVNWHHSPASDGAPTEWEFSTILKSIILLQKWDLTVIERL